ncbi:MAG TPA: TIGR03435 family protein [Edaphobacter sp.]|jgi:hypothetical protein|nr:TIGR03435 family protein [Edaphobacter sp.]
MLQWALRKHPTACLSVCFVVLAHAFHFRVYDFGANVESRALCQLGSPKIRSARTPKESDRRLILPGETGLIDYGTVLRTTFRDHQLVNRKRACLHVTLELKAMGNQRLHHDAALLRGKPCQIRLCAEVDTRDLPNADAAADAGPSLFTAVQEQLGLKLQSAQGPVQVLVVDQIEQLSEN